MIKTSDYIKNKQIQKRKETFEIKALSTSFNKVLLLVKFEQHYKIDRFNFNFENIDPTIEISDKFKELYSSLFLKRTIKSYKTKSDFKNNSQSAYDAAYKNNWLDEICQHMKKNNNVLLLR